MNFRLPPSARIAALLALGSASLAIAGCGIGSTLTSTDPIEDSGGGTFGGFVHGGQNPISGATIQLWVVGYTGYGSGPGSAFASTTTDSTGHFSFPTTSGVSNYTCPTGTNPQLVYLTATGGDSGSGSANTSIKLMAILLGPGANGSITSTDICSTLRAAGQNTSVAVNEVTTVVAMNVMAQFFNPSTERLGTSSTNVQAISNAFNLDANIMTPSTGVVNATYNPVSTLNLTAGTSSQTGQANTTATVEADKIYMLANIIAACVNTAGPTGSLVSPGACDTLFADAVPPPTPATTTMGSGFTFPAATDTLQAAYYLCVNPINATTPGVRDLTKMSELYNLPGSRQAFTSTGAQPTDWTIAETLSSSAYITTSTFLISSPTNLNVDALGHIVYMTTSAANPTGTGVIDMNNYGGFLVAGATSFLPITGLTLDTLTSGTSNVAFTTRNSNKTTYDLHSYNAVMSGTQFASILEDAGDTNLSFVPSSLASDGKNLFFTSIASGDAGSLFQVPLEGQASTPFTSSGIATLSTFPVNFNHTVSSLAAASPMVIDSTSNVWIAAGNSVYKIPYNTYPSSGASGTGAPTTPASVSGTFVSPAGLAVDHSNNVWITNAAGGSPADGYLSYYASGTGTVTSDATADHGGVNNPSGVAIDGAGNVWVANAGQTSAFTGQTVSEFALISGMLTALSPSVGFAHTYSKPGSIAVDTSGNVWIANTGSYATTTSPGFLTVLLGAASPVLSPIATGVATGKLGTLP